VPQYELNLRDYLRILRKRRILIIVTFLVVTASSFFYVSTKPVYYTAGATVKVEERKTVAGLLTEMLVVNPADVMESETKFIKSYPVMKKVGEKMGLIKESSSTEQINSIVGQLQGDVETEKVGMTNMIRITVTSNTPKEAMDLANTVAEVYIQENLANKARQSRQARNFIEEQLTSLEERLKKSEDRMRQFGDDAKNIRLADPIQKKLVDLQFQLAEFEQKYTDKHPKVLELKEQIQAMERQLSGLSGQEMEYARLVREVEVNKKLYSMLKEKLEETRITEAEKAPDVSMVNPALMPGEPISGNKLMGLMAGMMLGLILGLSFAFLFETLDTSIGTIEDVENVVKLPVLGVVPSIEVDERFRDKIPNLIERVKDRMFPQRIKSDEEQVAIRLIAHFKPQSPIAEAFRNINTNLKLGPNKKVLLFTSSGPREGKSGIVCNLAIVMAQTGLKVCIVSTDLRRPVIAKTFGIPREPGLNEYITGAAKLDDVICNINDILVGRMSFEDIVRTPGLENISIIPTGHLPFNPVDVIDSKEMKVLIEELRARFDVVIFDAPPVLPVTDSSILAPKMDSVVLVYEMGRMSREALLRTKVQLQSVGAKISGIILNNTNPHTEAITAYPYYYRDKYKYYDKEDEFKDKKAR
jgi:polysaccharide biosynthesis transport protein